MPSHDDEMRNEKYMMERDSESFDAPIDSLDKIASQLALEEQKATYGTIPDDWVVFFKAKSDTTPYPRWFKKHTEPEWREDMDYKLIAKQHEIIADAVVADPNTVVEFKDSSQMQEFQIVDHCLKGDFFESYCPDYDYRLYDPHVVDKELMEAFTSKTANTIMQKIVIDPLKAESDFAKEVKRITDDLADLLIAKNAKYGNSALEPKRIFSKASAVEQILVRIDDKLSRMANQDGTDDEDVIEDLMGYLVLLKIAKSNVL